MSSDKFRPPGTPRITRYAALATDSNIGWRRAGGGFRRRGPQGLVDKKAEARAEGGKFMSSHAASQDYLARIAGEIMFSEKYMDLLDHIYSTRDTIVEFELNPKSFLMRHGIHIPEDMDVIIHEPGTLGKRARVDFHWGESVQTAHSNILAARRRCRELARLACDTLHSREMEKLM